MPNKPNKEIELNKPPNPYDDNVKKLSMTELSDSNFNITCNPFELNDESEKDFEDEFDKLIFLLNKKHKQDNWYTPPKRKKDDSDDIAFNSEEEMLEYADMAAKKGLIFMACSHGKVIAYSNGDGQLYKNEEGKSFREIADEIWGMSKAVDNAISKFTK